MQDATLQSAGSRVRLFPQVETADQQFSFSYFQFEDRCQLIIPVEIVDRLGNRLVSLRIVVDIESTGIFVDGLPLPVAMRIGRELCKERMFIADDHPDRILSLSGEEGQRPV